MFTITRRNDRLPELAAITELRRANTIPAARRIAHEVAYRFFESTETLGSVTAYNVLTAILDWNGKRPIEVVHNGHHRFTLSIQ